MGPSCRGGRGGRRRGRVLGAQRRLSAPRRRCRLLSLRGGPGLAPPGWAEAGATTRRRGAPPERSRLAALTAPPPRCLRTCPARCCRTRPTAAPTLLRREVPRRAPRPVSARAPKRSGSWGGGGGKRPAASRARSPKGSLAALRPRRVPSPSERRCSRVGRPGGALVHAKQLRLPVGSVWGSRGRDGQCPLPSCPRLPQADVVTQICPFSLAGTETGGGCFSRETEFFAAQAGVRVEVCPFATVFVWHGVCARETGPPAVPAFQPTDEGGVVSG